MATELLRGVAFQADERLEPDLGTEPTLILVPGVGSETLAGSARAWFARRRPQMAFGGALLLGDVLATVLAFGIAGLTIRSALLVAAPTMLLLALGGHYRSRIGGFDHRDAGSVFGVVSVAVVAIGAAVGAKSSIGPRTALGYAAAVVLFRILAHAGVRRARSGGRLGERTLILGAGPLGCQVATTLHQHPEYGLEPVGFLDGFEAAGAPVPVLGPVGCLEAVLADQSIRHVVIAFGSTRDIDLVPMVRACDRRGVELHVVPRFFELGVPIDGRDVANVWGIPLQRLRRPAVQRHARAAKRGFDVTVASLALLVVLPLFGLIAIAVRLTDGGPVLFRQRRVGLGGQPIDVLKFRSMSVSSDSDTRWTAKDAVTPVGRVLRRTGLDELPQLFNVLSGQMSLVGPRPERPYFVEVFAEEVPRYGDRHRMPVGITGWAQVHGLRGDTPIDERARFDNQYVESWSLWRDAVILLQTIWAVVRDPLA